MDRQPGDHRLPRASLTDTCPLLDNQKAASIGAEGEVLHTFRRDEGGESEVGPCDRLVMEWLKGDRLATKLRLAAGLPTPGTFEACIRLTLPPCETAVLTNFQLLPVLAVGDNGIQGCT